MKKNLLGILILGLTFVNIIISGITMFSVMTTNQKTAKVVADVANAISIDLGTGSSEGQFAEAVPIENIETYSIPDKMTIALKPTIGDDKDHFCMVSVFFSINTKHKDYKKYSTTISEKENLFRSIINDTIAQYTLDDARVSQDEMKKEILKKVQEKYSGSDFIFDVSFSDIVFQ
ncbi:MAG: flagellar basal body-associated FliL family protein [Lachnospiraceae bacterium]|nr:flagellar basal body-associated FliL family protein [Lachnospiraceae bacterium]